MNIFKVGRGDFFGIIIPGSFLIINILFLLSTTGILSFDLPANSTAKTSTETFNILKIEAAILIPSLLILSYIIGFSLRAISPSKIERLLLYVIWCPICSLIALKKVVFNKKKEKKETFGSYYKILIDRYLYPFPYIEWFYGKYQKNSPNSYRDFWEQILKNEFKGKKELMKGQYFINQCKIIVFEKSVTLREEIIFNEGIIRFLSGVLIALALCIAIICYMSICNRDLLILLIAYFILFIIIGYRFKDIRMKEVVTIFDSIAAIAENDKLKYKLFLRINKSK